MMESFQSRRAPRTDSVCISDLTIKELTKLNVNLVMKLISCYYRKNIKLKLPNDILVNRRKICGILQEKVQKKGINYLIVGIGLNLIKSPNIKENPTTSLYELTKKKLNTKKVSEQLRLLFLVVLAGEVLSFLKNLG